MTFLAINYHYIGDEKKYSRGIYPVSPDRLRRQLETLGEYFTFVSQEDVLSALNGGSFPDRACMVTFDDGLMCQIEKALPVLEDFSIPAVFSVNSLPYEKGKALLTHKIHWTRAHLAPDAFLKRVSHHYEDITNETFSFDKVGATDDEIQKQYLYDTIEEARIKFFLNKSVYLAPKLRGQIVDAIFSELVDDERSFIDAFYMSPDAIRDLYQSNQLGFHGHTHTPLTLLSERELRRDFETGLQSIQTIIDNDMKLNVISYPHGSPALVSRKVAQAAKDAGFRFGLTMERALNTTLREPLLFARLDANDVPEGKKPLFEFENGDLKIMSNRLSPQRTAFIKESQN